MRIEDLKKPLQNAGLTVQVLPVQDQKKGVELKLRKKGVKASGQEFEMRAFFYASTKAVLITKCYRKPNFHIAAFSDFKIVENTIDTLVKKICATVAYWSAS